jgi:membrane protein YdbS with pleckstrin-like domain
MRSAHRARKISLALSMGVVYPLMLLSNALEWPAGVQLALGALALVVLIGVTVLLTDWRQWRADHAQLRRERALRKRARRAA